MDTFLLGFPLEPVFCIDTHYTLHKGVPRPFSVSVRRHICGDVWVSGVCIGRDVLWGGPWSHQYPGSPGPRFRWSPSWVRGACRDRGVPKSTPLSPTRRRASCGRLPGLLVKHRKTLRVPWRLSERRTPTINKCTHDLVNGILYHYSPSRQMVLQELCPTLRHLLMYKKFTCLFTYLLGFRDTICGCQMFRESTRARSNEKYCYDTVRDRD